MDTTAATRTAPFLWHVAVSGYDLSKPVAARLAMERNTICEEAAVLLAAVTARHYGRTALT